MFPTTPASYSTGIFPTTTLAHPTYVPGPFTPPPIPGRGIGYEHMPRYIKLKFKLIQWFENQKMCPYNLAHRGFPAWIGWKAVMAAGPAITAPPEGVAGWRSVALHGMCPKISSQKFSCAKTSTEVKARVAGIRIWLQLDQMQCHLQDIVLFKLANGFIGVRLDFGQCLGKTLAGGRIAHVPRTASMRMKLGRERRVPSAGFSQFFKAVCGGDESAAADFVTANLPMFTKFAKYGVKPNQFKSCFAETANAAHVIGKGCYEDFLFLDLEDVNGNPAEIPADDYDGLVNMIPGTQALVHPSAWQPRRYVPAPGPSPYPQPAPAPGPAPYPYSVYNQPTAGRKLDSKSSPCATDSPISPCTTAPPPTTSPPPPQTCANVVCPPQTSMIAQAASVPCENPQHCSQSDVYKCCVHHSPDVPGVIIQDRMCMIWVGCSCDNSCYCKREREPNVVTTTYTTSILPAPHRVCLDYPWESAIVACIAWCLCFRVLESIFWGVYSQWRMTSDGVYTKWKQATGATRAATELLKTNFEDIQPGDTDATWERDKITTFRTNGWAITWRCFPLFGIVSFIVLHLVWVVWLIFWRCVFRKWQEDFWNSINIWVCPFTLWAEWMAIWLSCWLLFCFLWAFKEESVIEKETWFVAAKRGAGGGGGGFLSTLAMATGIGYQPNY
jgi:hypothetical protein